MILDLEKLSANSIYHTMIQTIIPRPVAWVLTDNGQHNGLPSIMGDRGCDAANYNLAPFSYFTPVCSDPPMLMISVGKKPDGELKDTRLNIIKRKQFVVHIASSQQAESVTASSATFAHGCSEVESLGLELVPFEGFTLPRLKDCAIAYACELYECFEMGEVPQALIFGLVTHIYINDSIVEQTQEGRLTVLAESLDPLARLGGDDYWVGGRKVTVKRPK